MALDAAIFLGSFPTTPRRAGGPMADRARLWGSKVGIVFHNLRNGPRADEALIANRGDKTAGETANVIVAPWLLIRKSRVEPKSE